MKLRKDQPMIRELNNVSHAQLEHIIKWHCRFILWHYKEVGYENFLALDEAIAEFRRRTMKFVNKEQYKRCLPPITEDEIS